MELCPYHNTEPETKIFTARNRIDETYIDENGTTRRYVLPKLTIFKVFCPLCAASENVKGVSGKFRKGYSAHSEETAVRRWNSACLDEKLKIFKDTVKKGC